MKRFILRLITCTALLMLILPAVSLMAATGPVNPYAGASGPCRTYLPMIGKDVSPPILRHGPRSRRHVPDGLRPGAQRRLSRATSMSYRCTRCTWTRTASTGPR